MFRDKTPVDFGKPDIFKPEGLTFGTGLGRFIRGKDFTDLPSANQIGDPGLNGRAKGPGLDRDINVNKVINKPENIT